MSVPTEDPKLHKMYVLKGKDGKEYMSYPNKNGVFKWMLLSRLKRGSPPSEPADKHKYKVLTGKFDREYASLPDKNGVFKWKRYDTENLTNAIQLYKFWHTEEEQDKAFRFSYQKIKSALQRFRAQLESKGIHFYMLEDQGQWSDVNTHFINHMWEDVQELIKEEGLDKDKISYLVTDDVLLLRSILDGELYIYHSILKSDVKTVLETFKKCFNKSLKYNSKKAIILDFSGPKYARVS